MKLIFPIIFIAALFACQPKVEKKPVASNSVFNKKGECDCNLSPEEFSLNFPISAIKDSIVICITGIMNYADGSPGGVKRMKYIDFLREHTLGVQGKIFNCRKNEFIVTHYFWKSVTYKNASLVVHSSRSFYIYNQEKEIWEERSLPTYEEIIYSKNGVINITYRKMILEAPKYSKLELKLIQEKYDKQVKEKEKYGHYQLLDLLLAAAMNEDQKAKDHLQNYAKSFTLDKDITQRHQEILVILKDFEDVKKYKSVKKV